jgi:hypothetical protein
MTSELDSSIDKNEQSVALPNDNTVEKSSRRIANSTTNTSEEDALESGQNNEGEWELVGGRSKYKQGFSNEALSPKSSSKINSRRRRKNSRLKNPTVKHNALSNSLKSSSTSTISKNDNNHDLDESNSSGNDKHQQNVSSTSPAPSKNEPVNPWAKVQAVKPVPINETKNNLASSQVEVKLEKAEHTVVTNKNNSLNKNAPYSVKTLVNATASKTTLDSSDWPSLNLFDCDLNTGSQSTSLTEQPQTNTAEKVQVPVSTDTLENLIPQNKPHSTLQERSKQTDFVRIENEQDEYEQQHQRFNKAGKQIKWKPLMIDPPKRERKSYRNSRDRFNLNESGLNSMQKVQAETSRRFSKQSRNGSSSRTKSLDDPSTRVRS